MALNELTKYADTVIPVENSALIDICNKLTKAKNAGKVRQSSSIEDGGSAVYRSFDAMNNIVANLLLNMTRYFLFLLFKVQCVLKEI